MESVISSQFPSTEQFLSQFTIIRLRHSENTLRHSFKDLVLKLRKHLSIHLRWISVEAHWLLMQKKQAWILAGSPPHTLEQDFASVSVQFSCSVMSDSLWHHGLQHTRPPYPSPTPGVYSNSVHWVSDAIQPSHPLSSPSPPTFSLSQHQGLFKWVSSLKQVAKVLEFQLQHQSFQWTPRTDLL